ncbi:two-component system OmpR family sensor kinase [Isoptericola sp. CG 20/1183]|uniref:histidine kinase n=1 Tax=Isoptericola halotolerans TaxID=300560 RepID=A0ABX5EFF9_9MICO|nr:MULTISPECIES: HAMP domain-containing sensor histidine kinase [Isoptericola]PRZ08143.1 two-component system OmpR family sensor kinase [Isoptericola halotolerans]PRZ08940.1 two-component system OmpR family sensor kinase [Isoptericola sp. CG 20/1183]
MTPRDRPDGIEPTFAAPEAPGAASAAEAPPSGTDAPGPTAEPAPSTPGERRWSWLSRVPLRVRLVAIIVLLLGAGMVFAGIATRTVVSNYLVDQLDSQLKQSAQNVAEMTVRGPDETGPRIPSDYSVALVSCNGYDEAPIGWPQTLDTFGEPAIPDESLTSVVERGLEPFTVDSTGGSAPSQWRVVSIPCSPDHGNTLDGAAYVALPLAAVDKTTAYLSSSLLWSGIGIVLLGGALAFWLVQHSLRPLRRIEATAAAIAEGDLSQRVPEQPSSTEVGSLSRSLNVMLTQIESAFAVQEASEQRMRRFVSDASHELRTPLATVRGYGELYRMGALDTDEKVDDTMVRIEDSARRMGTLVNDLLVLARLDEGRPMRHEVVDLAALAHDTAQDLHALDPTRAVAVTGLRPGEAPPAALHTVGDADRLRQVLTNLVGNVARHTPAGSPAELALGTVAEGVVVEVRDHGPGVSDEQAGRIFERFYRADSSRNRESGGSGLGLAIVAAILGAHGGSAAVAQTPGGGLTVRVLLPPAGRYAA